MQRKVLQPNNFADLDAVEQALLAFGRRYEQIAQPTRPQLVMTDISKTASSTLLGWTYSWLAATSWTVQWRHWPRICAPWR